MAVLGDNLGDITANLPSLAFKTGLTDEERDILYIRKRSHALRTAIIAQASYLVAIINEGKNLIYEMGNSKNKKASSKIWKEIPKRRPLKIGLIGCGGLGKALIWNLLRYSDLHSEEIFISTRRPEQLVEFEEIGIQCFFDNKRLVQMTDVTFICCLPSQFQSVAEEIQGNVRCLLYSFVAGIPRSRLCKLLKWDDIIKTEFTFANKRKTEASNWNYEQTTFQALEDASSCESTCPGNDEESIIHFDGKLSEIMIFTFVNMCIVQNLKREQTVQFVNAVVFGPTSEERGLIINESDIWSEAAMNALMLVDVNERTFEIFSLDKLHQEETILGRLLGDHDCEVATKFRKRYVALFDRLNPWKTQCELVSS